MLLVMPYKRNEEIEFDEDSLSVKKLNQKHFNRKGVFEMVAGHKVAVYERSGNILLQIDSNKWNLSSENVKCRYHHDMKTKKTRFEINDGQKEFSVEYPAWWSLIPNFEPVEPEMDSEEDFMAYVLEVSRDASLRNELVHRWSYP